MRNVLVCEAQVPFVHGGAELHVRGLVAELTRRGYRAERVSVPFKWYPKDELLTHAAAWRMIDLSESNGERIDTVIATKFPTYFVRHPNKVTWLFHQYRAIYDLCGTPYSEFDHTEGDVALRARLIALDNDVLRESARLFANARNTAARLARYNGLTAEPLYHPPPLAGKLTAGPAGDYVLSVGRLEANKRVDLIIGALAHVDRRVRLVIVGEGPLPTSRSKRFSRANRSSRRPTRADRWSSSRTPSPVWSSIRPSSRWAMRSRGSPPMRGWRGRSATPATSACAPSPGTAWWINSWRMADGEWLMPQRRRS